MSNMIDTNNKIVQLKSYDDKTGKEIGNIFPITTCESVKIDGNKTLKDELLEMKNFRIVQTVEERDALTNVTNGEICFVQLDNVYYSRVNDEWEVLNSGSGGGGTSIGTLTSTLDGKTLSISTGETLEVDLFFATPNVGAGTVHVTSNNSEIQTKSIGMGSNKITLDLVKGTHNIEIYAVDRGGVYTNILRFTVQCGGLEIDTTFDWDDNYRVGSSIVIPYTIDTISKDPVIVHFKIGNQEFTKTASNSKYNEFRLPSSLGANVYKVEIYATSGQFESNRITNTLVILNSDSLFVSSLFDKEEAEEGDQLIIDYRVSMEGINKFDVVYYVNSQEHSRGMAVSGANTFAISTLPIGDNIVTIKVITPDQQEQSLNIPIKIVQSSYELKQPVIDDSLIAYADAYELSNFSPDKEVWKDKKTGQVIGTLHNFNYNTNGWINNGLKMNGSAYAKLNLQPFLDNAPYGLTIDIEFETEDVGNENAKVFDCTTTLGTEIGCFIDTGKAQIKSKDNTITSPFAQKEKTRVTYVIDRTNKITKLYVNAVMSTVARLTDKGTGNNKQLEDFRHNDYIYLNSTRGESNFGDCTVYSIKIYNRALDSNEVLQNHIADIRDKVFQKQKYDFNYHNTIPTMHFICDPEELKEMTKDRPVNLQIKYLSTNSTLYGQSFDLPNCEVKWQGTSSIVYAVKNYKIKLKDENGEKVKRALREGMIEESTFVLKADYMESSHANNTGCAKIVNKYLYNEPLPPKKENPELNIVSAIDGFPIKLFINDELMGVFNFNLDKGNDKSFGLDKDNPDCISYEISANTDTTAGAFNKWTGVQNSPEELEYLKKDFELRFPDDKEKPDYGYLDQLKRVVDWVSDADDTKFKAEFEQYFNKEYTFKYYLFVLVMGMVDNLGKNMMLNTWDGKIWYPCFYDLDTCLALDNSGYIKFDVDIEMEKGTYNTSGSKLWTKVGRVFKDEIEEMYRDMRSKTFKEDKLFSILLDEQIDQIPELLYNDDGQKKYIDHPEYIHMLHGSRREHMRKWLTERLLYLDSKMGYEMNTRDSITVRANKTGYVEFKIKTYSPMYVKVKWRNDNDSIKLQKVGRNQTVTFGYNLPTGTDQEILVYAAQHLKEIGDISAMKPSSLTLGNATRLTKLICKDSEYLQALGLGGKVNGVDKRMKNLQEIYLTGCSKLGTIDSNRGLDVSYCDNLKILKAQGTNLQNIQFNPNGGNLEELYLPNSMTTLYLANQHNLTKVKFPLLRTMNHRVSYYEGSNVSDLTIINCQKLTDLGTDVNLNGLWNYKGGEINTQSNDFDISKQDYQRGINLGCFGNLETVTIDNSLSQWKYFMINCSPSLRSVNFKNMANLKGVLFFGNKSYGPTGGSVGDNFEKVPAFENINVSQCDEFDTIIFQNGWQWCNKAYKFKTNFEWDLSHLRLKRFICNISLQNLKKLILPNTIEEFSHSKTIVIGYDETAGDGSKTKYTTDMSPLETIIIKGQNNDDFKGIDLNNLELKNVSLNGLTKKVNIIKNVNCEAIDIMPRIVSEHLTTSSQELENITINLNEFKLNTLNSLFAGVDMSKIRLIVGNQLNNPDYSYMFQNARNATWDNIKDIIKALPKGKFYRTFENCDSDKLLIKDMLIGESTVDLSSGFKNMPNVTEIDLTGANISNVTTMEAMFKDCPNTVRINLTDLVFSNIVNIRQCFQNNKVHEIIGVENLIQEKCTSLEWAFQNTNNLKFNFPNGKPNWRFSPTPVSLNYFMQWSGNGIGDRGQGYVLDLSDCNLNVKNLYQTFEGIGVEELILDNMNFSGGDSWSTLATTRLKTLKLRNARLAGTMPRIAFNNGLTTMDMTNCDMSGITYDGNGYFSNNPKLTNLTFGKGLIASMNMNNTNNLTKESIESIVDNIGTPATTKTLTLGSSNWNKLSEAYREKARNKGWTLA